MDTLFRIGNFELLLQKNGCLLIIMFHNTINYDFPIANSRFFQKLAIINRLIDGNVEKNLKKKTIKKMLVKKKINK